MEILLQWTEYLRSSKMHAETLTLSMMVPGGGIWGLISSGGWSPPGWHQHQIKGAGYHRTPLLSFCHQKTQGEGCHLQRRGGPSPELHHVSALILDLQEPTLQETHVYCL